MNKKGLYFATLTIVILIIFVVSYNNYLIVKENDVALGKIGEVASSSIEIFYEAERVKYYVNEAAKYSAFNATLLMGENGGIYDKTNCIQNDYIILNEKCELNVEEDFKKYFNDKFNKYLKDYNIKAEDFELTIDEEFKGVSKKNLELSVGAVLSSEVKFNVKDIDDKTANLISERIQSYKEVNIMEIIKKYSSEYDVNEALIKAVIAQESAGNVNAVAEVTHADGSKSRSWGLMQINDRYNKDYFNGKFCNGESASDSVDCNIKAGVEILKDNYDKYGDGRRYKCDRFCDAKENCQEPVDKVYTAWSAALRGYNGWGCTGAPDFTYVEKVLRWSKLFGGEILKDFDVKKIGSYYFKPEFLVDLNYNLNDFNEAKEVAENWVNGNCGESQENCVIIGYSLERKIVEDLMLFEFKSKEKLYNIKEVSIKFALPIKT